jgi:hypothetical protein
VTSTEDLRHVYAAKGLAGIPRLLTILDRSELSATSGCMDREYWLCRTTDFPSSILQFGAHALALAWSEPMPGNPYRGHPKIRRWIEAAIEYFVDIQRPDGSYDEFYPNERGWAGPTGFLVYAMVDSHRRIGRLTGDLEERFRRCISKAARFLYLHDESGVLANHHAIALAAIYQAWDLVREDHIREGFEVRLADFLTYCHEEGWCLEYDGADLGYLSATVSFLAKLEQVRPNDERIDGVIERAIEYASYFTYPNGYYAGTIGSRNTLHFYPAGFERYGKRWPLAQAVAQRLLRGLRDGALVPPEIMDDRYFVYRVPEMLLAWKAHQPRGALPLLPYERPAFDRYWPGSRMWARKSGSSYLAVNLAKGGVVKLFDVPGERLRAADSGFLLRLSDGRVLSNQWIDPDYEIRRAGEGFSVQGRAHFVVGRLMDPLRFMAFRAGMLAAGWNTRAAYEIKGGIRKLLMLGNRPGPVRFQRTITPLPEGVELVDEIWLDDGVHVAEGLIGDDFAVRYVPQSRYFQLQELDTDRLELTAAQLAELDERRTLRLVRRYEVRAERAA